MKLSIALVVLATVASTYASPMPNYPPATQLGSQGSLMGGIVSPELLKSCQELVGPGEGIFSKIAHKVKTTFREFNDRDVDEQVLHDMCQKHLAAAAAESNSTPSADSYYRAASGTGNFADQGYGGGLGATSGQPGLNAQYFSDDSAADYPALGSGYFSGASAETLAAQRYGNDFGATSGQPGFNAQSSYGGNPVDHYSERVYGDQPGAGTGSSPYGSSASDYSGSNGGSSPLNARL